MIRLPYGTAESREPVIHVHRFQSRDTKTEQRFYAGAGERRLQVSLGDLAPDERTEVIDQFAAASGSYLPFTIDLVGPSGAVESLTVRFAVPRLEIQTLIDGSSWAASFELIVDPGAEPSYTSASAETRFPGSALQAALLSPVQEIIPLVVITPISGEIRRVSERGCTVDGSQYLARLLDWDGIKQSLYGADQASFTLANADRAFTAAVNAENWHAADVQFSLLHVGSLTKINLWRGHVIPGGWDLSGGNVFRITAADGAYELRLAYPPRKITRQDGFVTPADHQPVNLGRGKNRITATSVVHDSGFGRPLKDIWVNDATAPLKVTCDVIAGRDEREFYSALGIVGRGPIGNFGALPIIEGGSAVHYGTLDGQPNHGPGLFGLRRSRGGNPANGSEVQSSGNPDAGSDILAIDEAGSPLPAQPAPAGAAFLQIRRTDEAGIQPDNATKEHEMIAFVSEGNGGYIWTGGVRTWSTAITNLAWVAVNVWLRGNGVGLASQAVQEEYFVVSAAEAFAATCGAVVDALVGAGTEPQFQFVGTIAEEKPLRDWLKEILAGGLGYFTFAFGKLKLGSRFHSGSTEAFDSGNIILNSLALSAATAEYNSLSATFADREYGYLSNPLEFRETDHIAALGQELKATMNLVGVCTKSQAARLVTTLVRERLGGVDAAEWAAARRLRFATTVLALNVECGTISALTHEDMPGGSGEFITEGWSLNRDMSISIEGRSTTDAMYDMLVGNKPTDVPVNLPLAQTDKLPGLFVYTPVVKDLGFLTLTDCSMTDGSNRGMRSVTVFLVFVDDTEPDNWVTLDASLGTGDPATFNVTPNGVVSFDVDDYILFDDAGGYEIAKITALATNTWTLQRNWPGNDPAEAIFESLRVAHAAGTRIYKCKIQKFSFNAAGGTFENSGDTGTLAAEFPCQLADARVVAVIASAANGYGYSDWVVYNLGAGLDTDSMSSYAAGITPPGEVTIDSADYEFIDAYRLRVRVYWSPPAILGTFVGVHCFHEAPDVSTSGPTPMDGTQAMDGTTNLGGEWAPIDRGRGTMSPFVIEMDAVRAAVTDRFYLSSYSTGAEAALVRATEADPTPSITLAIAPVAYQNGVEYAQLVTGFVATVEYDDSHVGSPKYRIRFQWSAPAIAPAAWQRGFGGVQIVYEYNDGRRANGPAFAVNETDAYSGWYELRAGSSVVRCLGVSYDNSDEPRVNSIVPGVTPLSIVVATWPLVARPPESPYADNVTGFVVHNDRYEVNGAGQKVLMIDWFWTPPVGTANLARWGGDVIFLYLPADPNAYACTGKDRGPSGTMEFNDFPSGAVTWKFRAISYDNNDNPNTDPFDPIAGTPECDINVDGPTLGGTGLEYTSNVTGFTATAGYSTDGQGQKQLQISSAWTRPSDPTFAGPTIYAIVPGITNHVQLTGMEPGTSVESFPGYFPAAPENWTVYALAQDVNGRSNTYDSGITPKSVITVNPPTLGAAGVEYTSNVTGYSFSVLSLTGSDGTTPQRIGGVFTPPTDKTWGGVEIRIYDGGGTLVAKSSAATSPVAVTIPNPTTSTTYTVKLVSFDVNGKSNTETGGTPQDTVLAGSTAGTMNWAKFDPLTVEGTEFEVVSGKVQMKGLNFTKAIVGTFLGSEFEVSAGAFKIKELAADKITTGILSVGGGGGKVSKFAVFNNGGSAIGWIGDDTASSGYDGAWFKR
jgi:hypothetical protein